MKFCTKCGKQMEDEAMVCLGCGRVLEGGVFPHENPEEKMREPSKLGAAAKIFMIIGTVFMSLITCCFGLAWCLPMTLSYCKKLKDGTPISTGFKVCSLLFVNTIAGILMLCDDQ